MGSPPRRPVSMADFGPPLTHDETAVERKAAAQRRYDEHRAERQRQLSALASPHNTPAERIRIWESVHQLTLPRSAGHRLIDLIANETGVGVAAVHEEQHRRANSP